MGIVCSAPPPEKSSQTSPVIGSPGGFHWLQHPPSRAELARPASLSDNPHKRGSIRTESWDRGHSGRRDIETKTARSWRFYGAFHLLSSIH